MWQEWRSRKELKHFKALGVNALPFSAVLHWDTDEPTHSTPQSHTLATLWRLSVHPALKIENLLPCTMSVRITTSLASDPPSPR